MHIITEKKHAKEISQGSTQRKKQFICQEASDSHMLSLSLTLIEFFLGGILCLNSKVKGK